MRAKVTPGTELFARLPEDQQRATLGPAKFAADRADAITLEDLHGARRDPRWGRVGFERSLRDILGESEVRQMAHRAIESRVPRRGSVQLSSDPTDVLIRNLIQTGRGATAEEIDQIVDRFAEAKFPLSTQHLAKRLDDKQWTAETSVEDYVSDLRRAIRDESGRLTVYKRRGGNLAGILTETERIVPAQRRGDRWDPLLFVVYSADRGIILSGYQAHSLETIALPKDVRWLR
jgi:hypothetical protein